MKPRRVIRLILRDCTVKLVWARSGQVNAALLSRALSL